MARFRKPFFRSVRGLWYVWHDGRQVNLGADKDAAFTAWHELRAKPAAPVVTQAEAQKLVVVIVDEFLDWCHAIRCRHAGIRAIDRESPLRGDLIGRNHCNLALKRHFPAPILSLNRQEHGS